MRVMIPDRGTVLVGLDQGLEQTLIQGCHS